ncbi:hypothetical protein LPJ53_006324 [Coemansia erecta]|uniref:Complex 1 LYR protein domain-containing protein n=1 Tax=Coemansia erecta TaxID=147472 RepID=A0A9W8CPF0_9FUNG|nr:hypothetical protein LPJ53_006324 [Coemansia erecta]
MLLKRKLTVECLYAGLFALQQQSGLEAGRGRLDLLYAALLADGDSGLVQLYTDVHGDRRRTEQIDTVLLASIAYHLSIHGNKRRMQLIARHLSPRARRAIEWAAKSPVSLRSLVNGDTAARVDSAWSLRRPTVEFKDMQTAGKVVLDLLRSDIIPDQAVLETLISSCVRMRNIPHDVLPVYASHEHNFGLSDSTLVRLVGIRSTLGRRLPRIHFDVLGTLVRLKSLDGALIVVSALRNRQMFHFLLDLWKSTYTDDWRAVNAITKSMVASLNGRIMHSTHHLVLTATLDTFKTARRRQSKQANEILSAALSLHWLLAPRLETPSVAAIHQLITQLADSQMAARAFQVYRDAEQRGPQWAQSRRTFATEAIFAALARGLAQDSDTRSIMHLISTATRLGIYISSHFYTAVICGLTDPQYIQTTTDGYHVQPQHDALQRVQTAETILEMMRRNNVTVPPKVLYALMHAWALLGNTRKTRWYSRRMRRLVDTHVVGMHSWGMLMYSLVQAQDAQGAINVLYQAREWLRTHKLEAHVDAHRTSYLVNISMTALVRAGRSKDALSLLDSFIDQTPSKEEGTLAATPADPVTLSLVIGALLAEHQLAQAIAVYSSISKRYGLAENTSELRRLLRYALRFGHLDASLEITARLLRADGRLKESQWIRLLQLSFGSGRYETVYNVYSCMCACMEPPAMLSLLRRHPAVLELAEMANAEIGAPVNRVKYSPAYRAVSLYRRLLRAVAGFPLREMRGKLRHNVRFCYELYRNLERDDPQIPQLISDGHVQAEWLLQWQRDPGVLEQIRHRSDQVAQID